MKQHILILLAIFSLAIRGYGQDVQYPHRQMIESKNYAQAESAIRDALMTDSLNCAELYAACMLYSQRDFSGYNHSKAYAYILACKDSYTKTRDKSKLLKMKITTPNINKAIIELTQVALDKASEQNTRESYSSFLKDYPLASAKQTEFAKNRIQIFDFWNGYHEDWDYMKECIQKYSMNQELISILNDSIFQFSKRDPRLDMIKYGFQNYKSQEMRDSCILLIHKVYEDCGVYNFTEFWKTYFSTAFRLIKEHDEEILATHKTGNKFNLVIVGAPYNCAYQAFWDLISGRIKARDWEGALHKMNAFEEYFAGNSDFKKLKHTLQKPENEQITIETTKTLPAAGNLIPESIHKPQFHLAPIMPGQTHPTFSSDGNVVIFSAKSKTNYELSASDNLFVAIKGDNGKWGKPFEIGNQLNTPFKDCSPFLMPDNRTLYFCSEGHGSLGQLDVFVTTRLSSDSWTDWSEPESLGKQINTSGNEQDFVLSPDGFTGYLSTNVDGKYQIKRISMPIETQTKKSTEVVGTVVDSKGRPVSSQIVWEDLDNNTVIGYSQTGSDGRYSMTLQDGKNYGYYINNPNYYPASSNIDLRGKKLPTQISNNIQVVAINDMLQSGQPVVLRNIFFNSGNFKLLSASQSELARFYNIIKDKKPRIEIAGFTDNTGDDNSNQILSENRAKAVKDYLVKLGYPAELLSTIGHGRHKPIATNTTPQGRQQNRRVEFRVER